MSEQCRVKLTAGRVKSQGGVDGIADATLEISRDDACISVVFAIVSLL